MKFSLKTIFIVFLVLGCIVSPAAARGPTIKDILPEDFIFLYEEGLDLTGLTSDGQVQSLRKIVDGDPDTPLLPVGSAVGSWDVPDYLEEDDLGTYAVINGSGVWESSVYLTEPELKLEVTLADLLSIEVSRQRHLELGGAPFLAEDQEAPLGASELDGCIEGALKHVGNAEGGAQLSVNL